MPTSRSDIARGRGLKTTELTTTVSNSQSKNVSKNSSENLRKHIKTHKKDILLGFCLLFWISIGITLAIIFPIVYTQKSSTTLINGLRTYPFVVSDLPFLERVLPGVGIIPECPNTKTLNFTKLLTRIEKLLPQRFDQLFKMLIDLLKTNQFTMDFSHDCSIEQTTFTNLKSLNWNCSVKLQNWKYPPLLNTNITKFNIWFSSSPYGHQSLEWLDLLIGQYAALRQLFKPSVPTIGAVTQDTQGTCLSSGNFSGFATAKYNMHHSIQYLRYIDNHDKIWLFGLSADGFNAIQAGFTEPDQSTTKPYFVDGLLAGWTNVNLVDQFYPGGIYRESLVNEFFQNTAIPRLPGWGDPDFLINQFMLAEDPEYEWFDLYKWPTKAQENAAKWPMVYWAGWWDTFFKEQYNEFEVLSNLNGDNKFIVIEPVGHCFISGLMYLFNTELGHTCKAIGIANDLFIDGYTGPNIHKYTFYVMTHPDAILDFTSLPSIGKDYFFWISAPIWPETIEEKWYIDYPSFETSKSHPHVKYPNPHFQPFDQPGLTRIKPNHEFRTSYVYDPRYATLTEEGHNLFTQCGPNPHFRRTRQITSELEFVSDPLLFDKVISGTIKIVLQVSSSSVDTDFFVSIYDISGFNIQSLVRTTGLKMQRRHGFEKKPENITPHTVYEIELETPPIVYVFKKHHKIMMNIKSSDFPAHAISYNDGKLLTTPNRTSKVALNTIYNGSFFVLPVVDTNEWRVYKKAHSLHPDDMKCSEPSVENSDVNNHRLGSRSLRNAISAILERVHPNYFLQDTNTFVTIGNIYDEIQEKFEDANEMHSDPSWILEMFTKLLERFPLDKVVDFPIPFNFPNASAHAHAGAGVTPTSAWAAAGASAGACISIGHADFCAEAECHASASINITSFTAIPRTLAPIQDTISASLYDLRKIR